MGRKCVQALAAGLGIYFAPAARLSSAADPGGPCAAAIDLNLDEYFNDTLDDIYLDLH